MTIKTMLQQLSDIESQAERFIRVHRSYIVPMNRIEAVQNKTIRLSGRDIPIGTSYEAEFFQHFGAQ